ncbi:unnamed protein product [Calypogeia fissa]
MDPKRSHSSSYYSTVHTLLITQLPSLLFFFFLFLLPCPSSPLRVGAVVIAAVVAVGNGNPGKARCGNNSKPGSRPPIGSSSTTVAAQIEEDGRSEVRPGPPARPAQAQFGCRSSSSSRTQEAAAGLAEDEAERGQQESLR